MGDKTAIERLRELLDERGAMHVGGGEMVRWVGKDGCVCRAYSRRGDLCLDVSITYVSPERAIDATLGRGTCHPIISDNLNESEGAGDAWADCSECGHLLFVLTDQTSEPPRYCPNCGRKVVDE